MVVTPSAASQPAARRTRPVAIVLVAAATVLVLLTAACASSGTPSGTAVAGVPVSSGGGAIPVCTHDAVVATYQTAYDGAQPLCRGFAGDATHTGEGLTGAETTDRIDTVVQWMLLHARAIYSFQPSAAWLGASPHPRDVNGFFHRQSE